MPFDLEGARQAGYSDDEIAGFLASQSGFDLEGARRAGYQPQEVIGFLSERTAAAPAPAAEPQPLGDPMGSGAAEILAQPTQVDPDNLPRRMANEASQLRDEFFSGVDQARAAVSNINTGVIYGRRLAEVEADIRELEARGRGDSLDARQMRAEAESLRARLPQRVAGTAELNAAAQRGSQMATRPAVQKVAAAKTLGEAWEAFKESPYDVIAGVTAQSLPQTLPALIAGAVAGPAVGAVAMGASSGATEFGSSLADFARDNGVDATDAKALQAFYTDPEELGAALAYAGKRAGIIGTLDAASGGIAGKTIAPPLKSALARQAVNVPAQMAVQGALGAAGEAGGQLATKGEITEPGQVLLEAAGELGGAPAEVAAFSREVHAAVRGEPTPQAAPSAAPSAVAVLAAPTVDAAIETATAAISAPPAPGASAVDNIARILGQEATNAAAPAAAVEAAAAPAAPDQAAAPAGPAPEAATAPDGGAGPAAVGAGTAPPAAVAPPAPIPAAAPAAATPFAGAAPRVVVNPTGTVTITGDARAIEQLLRAQGVTRMLPASNGVLVGTSDAQAALRAMAPFAQPQTQPAAQNIPESIPAAAPAPAQPVLPAQPPVQLAPQLPAGPAAAAQPVSKKAPRTPRVTQRSEGDAFRTFLMRNGVALRLAREFVPGTRERLAMGRTFRKGGLELDVLAELAAQDGYIRDRSETDALYELIQRAVRGERVTPLYTPEGAELQARIQRQRDLDEAQAVAALQALGDNELLAVEAAIPDLGADSDTSTEDAMRALGFTEQEIRDAVAQGPAAPQEAGQGGGRPGQGAAAAPPRADRGGEAAPPAAAEPAALSYGSTQQAPSSEGASVSGLTAPTEREVLEQQRRRTKGERMEAERRRIEQQRADADAQRGDFTLTGSDRPADVAAAGGQQDLLAPSAERGKIEDLGEKIGGARKDTAAPTGSRTRRAAPEDNRPTWAKRFQISQIAATGEIDQANVGRWVIHDTRSTDRFGQARPVGGWSKSFATKEEAEAFLPLAAVAMNHRAVPTRDGKYEIWRDINDRKRVKVVDRIFETRDDATAYMAEHAAEILETNTTFGEADLPTPPDRVRVGPARRSGDVQGEDFLSTFGFRGVEFGNWNNQDERQALMNDAYDALMDLADVLGMPPKALGLNGDLALAFGARGQGLNSARAHYEHERAVINLTKEHGAGSLAHEWFHGLDHYFGRQDGKASSEWVVGADGTRTLKALGAERDMASGGFRVRNSGVREEVRAAYEALINTIFKKATTYVDDTAKADQFTARAKDELARELDSLRKELSAQKDPAYYKRNNKPATAEQLAEFDTLAKRILEGEAQALETDWRGVEGAQKRIAYRWTNDSLEQIGAIFKAVRGRSGFDATNRNGTLDSLQRYMKRYSERLHLLADAQKGAQKTRMVPTEFSMNAKELDQGRGGDYWTTPHEMAARAFQGFVEDKIAEAGGVSRFLNYAPENAGILTPWGVKRPYPHGEERTAINAALERFVRSLQTEETEQGVRLYALTDGAQRRTGNERMPSGLTMDEAREAIRQMRGARVADVQAIVDGMASGWKNGPEITVVQSARDLPGNNPSDSRGLYQRGRIWIVAAAHRAGPTLKRSVARTLAHEAVAHYGLRDMLGREGWKQLMANIQLGIKAGNRELRRIQQFVRETYVNEDGSFALNEAQEADEIAAKAVEEAIDEQGNFRPGFGFLKSVWARVAQFLRDLGVRVSFSNAELHGMLVLSMQGLQAGERTAGGGQLAVAAAREDGAMHARGATADEQPTEAAPSRPETSPWRDATGRLQFAPGAWLYEKLGDLAGPMLSKLQLKTASPELRRALREMKLQVQKAQETAAAVAGEAMKLSEAERQMVSDLIEQELAAGTVPPEHAVRLAAMINANLGAQTDELVRLGMLTSESAEMWRGKYLPRFYRSKLALPTGNIWADAMRRVLGMPRSLTGIKGKHLKGRGLYQTIPEAELPVWQAQGWEVRDPDYQPGLTGDGSVQVWRDFSRAEREQMGEIRDAGFRFVMGYMQTQRDIALGRMFEQLAQDPDLSARRESEEFSVQVPDGTVPGTGAKRYGKLAGRWVSKDTMSHLSQIEEAQSSAWRMYRQAMAWWKMGKTALNPVSHTNNVLSNLSMAHFAGVSYWRADKYLAAARDFATKAEAVREAKDAGLFLGTLSEAELFNTLPEELRILVRAQESKAAKAVRTGFDVMTFFLRRPMGWAYQAEDTFFRYLIYKDARERGLDAADAVDYAQRYIFTYDDLPKGARLVRDFSIPFFAYTYKAAPALLHTALTHPLRMAAPAAVLWAANAAAYAIAAGDDDDSWDEKLKRYLTDPAYRAQVREKERLEREFLPPWMKGTTALMTPKAVRLGTDELTKLPVFIDVSRIVPGGDLFDVSPNAGGIPLPQPVTPSHPLFTVATAMLANKDVYFGKEIVDLNDTRGEATAKRADWLWKQLSPAIAVGNYHWERGMNALAQASGGEVKWLPEVVSEKYTGLSRDGTPMQTQYALAQTFGIKARPIDLELSEKIDQSLRQKMIRDIDAEMRKLQRLNAKGAISDSVLDKERERAQEKKQRLREGLTVDGEPRD